MDEVGVDVAAVRGTADTLRSSAEVITACARSIDGCSFGVRDAGHSYSDHGRAMQVGYGKLSRALTSMAASSADCARALHVGTDRYTEADRSGASSLQGRL